MVCKVVVGNFGSTPILSCSNSSPVAPRKMNTTTYIALKTSSNPKSPHPGEIGRFLPIREGRLDPGLANDPKSQLLPTTCVYKNRYFLSDRIIISRFGFFRVTTFFISIFALPESEHYTTLCYTTLHYATRVRHYTTLHHTTPTLHSHYQSTSITLTTPRYVL